MLLGAPGLTTRKLSFYDPQKSQNESGRTVVQNLKTLYMDLLRCRCGPFDVLLSRNLFDEFPSHCL